MKIISPWVLGSIASSKANQSDVNLEGDNFTCRPSYLIFLSSAGTSRKISL